MSMKLKASYSDDVELEDLLAILNPKILKFKTAQTTEKDKYKRAYITLKNAPTKPANCGKSKENA